MQYAINDQKEFDIFGGVATCALGLLEGFEGEFVDGMCVSLQDSFKTQA